MLLLVIPTRHWSADIELCLVDIETVQG